MAAVEGSRERCWRPEWPCPVGQVLGPHRRGPGDPTHRVGNGLWWRATRTPEGPTTLAVRPRPDTGEVRARAWGAGAGWALDQLPSLLGADDDVRGFAPGHPAVARAHRQHPHWRIGRTGQVFEALLPAVLEQRVTGQEAYAGFRRLVHRYGDPAPGGHGLRLPPTPEVVARIPSWEWLRLPVDPSRAGTAVTVAQRAGALPPPGGTGELARALRSLPGVGQWTVAEVLARAEGDADAVSLGDYHLAADVGWVVRGEPFDDDQLATFLEPFRPHRGRVAALLTTGGQRRPRRGPRAAPRTHLPAPVRRR